MVYHTLLQKNPDQVPAGCPFSGTLSSPACTQSTLQRSAYLDPGSSWWIPRRGPPGSPDSFAISLADLVLPAHCKPSKTETVSCHSPSTYLNCFTLFRSPPVPVCVASPDHYLFQNSSNKLFTVLSVLPHVG
ncbi:hypothetical protein ATANTOWER_006506 [Ataeniobius toweri]|uniref:Uncharacterized protein n=1 Tax=Ataeniobius toweri TaxID=208326 RepID=A0ABU7BX39_9TELE|nr:hypothetical protein [Ataeniobius toweri]